MKIFGDTCVGRVRENNQDSYRIVRITDAQFLCVVCDGMGGAAGGSTASALACETAVDAVKAGINAGCDAGEYEALLGSAVEKANSAVYEKSRKNKELEGMGTTLCAVLTDGKRISAVSVGDSRIYMFDKGKCIQLSHDHSYVQTLVDSGAITKEEAMSHPNKNIITHAVGTTDTIEWDTFSMDFTADAVLVCSDGLTNYVKDDELNEMFLQYNKTEELVRAYIQRANDAGGGDNITALVVNRNEE